MSEAAAGAALRALIDTWDAVSFTSTRTYLSQLPKGRHVQRLHQTIRTQGLVSGQAEVDDDEGLLLVNHHPTGAAQQPLRNALDSNQNGIVTIRTGPPRGRPKKSLQVTKKPTEVVARPSTFIQGPPMPFELNLSAFQAPICVTFLVQNFLGHLDTGRKSLLPAWDVDNVSGTARYSINALALAFYGKAHHQQNIIQQGAECYGKALLKLAHDLHDRNAMWSSSVLLSSILLARYELVASTGSEGWIQHAGGVERLFQARGPGRHQSLEERHIFEAARPIIAIKAITDCKRTFLDQEAWLTLPWAQDPGQKSFMNQLIDIFCIIPGLLEDSKSLHSNTSFIWDFTTPTSPSTGTPARQDPRLVDLRQRTQECYIKLRTWKEAWDRSHPSAVQSVKISYFPRSDLKFPEDIFSYAITFPNFLRANEYQLYNTVVFFLSTLMLYVPPVSPDELQVFPVSELLGQRWEAAYNICRAVPYDLFEKHGGSGAYLLLFPLLTNLRLFGEASDEGKWIKQVLESIANKWGLEGERKYMAI
ncbi:MAG: hypothetical protein ASARMPREDX12_007393 [Alectoria sarmentosa]|nr:MAG: hypothetical protein ASARMPREDX12_007393 [Alectoria sarmentosa]